MGKLGELTRNEMNAIQYGAEAGALGQIAQGRALQAVHGHGQGFQQSYSNTAYLGAHQSLSQQKGAAEAYDKETNHGSIKTAESMGRVSNASALRSHVASVGAAGSEENIVSSNAGEAAEKALTQAVSHGTKVALGARNSNGTLNLGSEATAGLMAGGLKDAGAAVGNAENTVKNLQKSLETLKDKTAAEHKENYVDNVGGTLDELKFHFASKHTIENFKDAITGNGKKIEERKEQFFAEEDKENKRLVSAKNESEKAFTAANDGDFAEAGRSSAVQSYTMGAAGTTGTFNASGGFVQGGTQSGVSLSHNTQHSYSSGITANGGSFFAAGATSMGFSADGFAAGASALSAVTQTASFMAGPVGRGSLAAASALGSTASGGASAIAVRLNAADNRSMTFAQNQLANIGDFTPTTLQGISSRLASRAEIAQERMKGANGTIKKNKDGSLTIGKRQEEEIKGRAF